MFDFSCAYKVQRVEPMVKLYIFLIRGVAMETVIGDGVWLSLLVCCAVLHNVVVGLLAGVSYGINAAFLKS